MLQLKEIVKNYVTGDTTVQALKGINITFRDNEFVSILGQSGCGKTTMLNIIGGLDQYTSGDLVINGISTKEYKDRNWDSYRNHSIGFIFQSYNLIPHQTVLSNVELALTLSGVSKKERKQRAIEALTKVGLGDQLYKKPNQMSGGQMQRVAIARALVNDPEILLADEPTGALDTQTSVQIMEILKEIAKDRLIIMVTHNPELAEQYSTRIVKLLDGNIIDDSNPYDPGEVEAKELTKPKKTSMKFGTALSLSLNNLMTKKKRTFLTAFAGSIGIIGIAMILSLSSGVKLYIDDVQRDTLSSYPIMIEKETMDVTSLVETMTGQIEGIEDHSDETNVYSSDVMVDLMNTVTTELKSNNLKDFKKYIEDNKDIFSEDVVADIQYRYSVPIIVYKELEDGEVLKVNPSTLMESMMASTGAAEGTASMHSGMMTGMNVWAELLDNRDLLNAQYDVVAGNWPNASNEVVLMVDKNNNISDYALYSLGLKDPDELTDVMKALMKGEKYESKQVKFSYDELLKTEFKLVLPTDYYAYDEQTKTWVDKSEDNIHMTKVVANAKEMKVVGIVRPNEDNKNGSGTGGIGYTSGLAEYIINEVNDSEIVKQQKENGEVDVFTGIPFEVEEEEVEITMEMIQQHVATLPPEQQQEFQSAMAMLEEGMLTEEQLMAMFKQGMEAQKTNATYDGNMTKLGVCDLDSPSGVYLYATKFESKDMIEEAIADYNKMKEDDGKEEDVISYTDYVGLMMSSVTTIINAISYILIAFVAISLVVSSIMIGIITYISVLERIKEIGILRSIGASKKDISRVFNAETVIVGFTSGSIGIIVTLLLLIPANIIIEALTDISGLAKLPVAGAVILIAISVILTFISGLVPAKVAANKDPVEALRTE